MISATSRYALRSLAELARLPEGAMMLGRDLAAETGIPGDYLSKILLRLRKAGIVEASRGRNGGYRLYRHGGEATLLEVVELFEGPSTLGECLLRTGTECSVLEPCSAHREWSDVRDRYLEFLRQTTVGAIAQPFVPPGPDEGEGRSYDRREAVHQRQEEGRD